MSPLYIFTENFSIMFHISLGKLRAISKWRVRGAVHFWYT